MSGSRDTKNPNPVYLDFYLYSHHPKGEVSEERSTKKVFPRTTEGEKCAHLKRVLEETGSEPGGQRLVEVLLAAGREAPRVRSSASGRLVHDALPGLGALTHPCSHKHRQHELKSSLSR